MYRSPNLEGNFDNRRVGFLHSTLSSIMIIWLLSPMVRCLDKTTLLRVHEPIIYHVIAMHTFDSFIHNLLVCMGFCLRATQAHHLGFNNLELSQPRGICKCAWYSCRLLLIYPIKNYRARERQVFFLLEIGWMHCNSDYRRILATNGIQEPQEDWCHCYEVRGLVLGGNLSEH